MLAGPELSQLDPTLELSGTALGPVPPKAGPEY